MGTERTVKNIIIVRSGFLCFSNLNPRFERV